MPKRHAAKPARAGVLLPGNLVEDERTGQKGTIVVPSREALAQIPDGSNIMVRWRNDRETWVDAKRLRRIDRL